MMPVHHLSPYEVLVADEPRSRRIHHRLRYRVFCLETGYEDPAAHPDGEERDGWDRQAAHFLVRCRERDRWVAAARLVLPHPHRGLPIAAVARLGRCPDAASAEISRLSVVGQARRRIHQPAAPSRGGAPLTAGLRPLVDEGARVATRPVLQALLRALVAYSLDHGVEAWYLLVARAFARLLERTLPMRLEPVGPPCWHRGERIPYRMDVAETALALGREALTGAYALASQRLASVGGETEGLLLREVG